MAGHSCRNLILTNTLASPTASSYSLASSTIAGCDLLRLPLVSLAPAPAYSSSDTTLCGSQRRLGEILGHANSTQLSTKYVQSERLLHRPGHSPPPYSEYAMQPPLTSIENLEMTFRRSRPAFNVDSTTSASPSLTELQRLHVVWHRWTMPPAYEERAFAEDRGDFTRNAESSLGLVLGMSSRSLAAPRSPTTSSRRLRRLAPPPLKITPIPSSCCSLSRVPTPPLGVFTDILRNTHIQSADLSPALTLGTPLSASPASDSFSEETFVSVLQWRRTVSRALDSPLPPLTAAPRPPWAVRVHFWSIPRSSSVLAFDAAPPPLRRQDLVALPSVPDEGAVAQENVQLLSPLRVNLFLDLEVEDLVAHAESCMAAIDRASLSLRSCSLWRNPDAIVELCEGLRSTLQSLREALEGTPSCSQLEAVQRTWYTKHRHVITSVRRNLEHFYLLADQIGKAPPRIYRLAGLMEKMIAYNIKFADLVRRIKVRTVDPPRDRPFICVQLSHEKLRLVQLRTRFVAESDAMRAQAEAERARRREFATVWQEGRTRLREMRDEMRRVREAAHSVRMEWVVPNGGVRREYPSRSR
ncbi:hypothetical protein A0H81_10210 [Grifola frondosa]|uniref:Uncharacterized protein n=1 Tax=Grifola frondosa TaxID=5627 RepID=A0A1C7M0C7_GRIFR|nr:hypothetical protein A0H81_10210 [Grifola frondosa]